MAVDERKRDPLDFALWKAAKPGEPSWDSPWMVGRPGWHIECVAMSLGLLGDGFDIHGGGSDLIFPHHENERAEAEAAGHRFARLWMHSAMVNVEGEKMAKSAGNFRTLAEVLALHDPRALRLAMLQAHYRSTMEIDEGRARGSGRRHRPPRRLRPGASALPAPPDAAERTPDTDAARAAFADAMDNDMGTPGAVGVIFELLRKGNVALDNGETAAAAAGAVNTVRDLGGALGLRPAGLIAGRGNSAADRQAAGGAGGAGLRHRRSDPRRVGPTRASNSRTPPAVRSGAGSTEAGRARPAGNPGPASAPTSRSAPAIPSRPSCGGRCTAGWARSGGSTGWRGAPTPHGIGGRSCTLSAGTVTRCSSRPRRRRRRRGWWSRRPVSPPARSRFYRTLAAGVPVQVPGLLHARHDGTRFLVVLEDLNGRANLPASGDACTARQALNVISALADLHAFGWGRPQRGQLQRLAPGTGGPRAHPRDVAATPADPARAGPGRRAGLPAAGGRPASLRPAPGDRQPEAHRAAAHARPQRLPRREPGLRRGGPAGLPGLADGARRSVGA